jgi:hypothetical protein
MEFELSGRIFGHQATLPQKGPEEDAPPTFSPSLIWAGESYIMVGNYYLLISNKINVVSARTRLSGSADDSSASHPSKDILSPKSSSGNFLLKNRPERGCSMKCSTKSKILSLYGKLK